ncbi:MAG: peptide-methionine (S)-S-oxide reductase MsrA [Anaerolineales bacterium]
MTESRKGAREQATLAGGCFWCLEPVFEELEGVEDVVVGYSGGSLDEPTYSEVSAGRTGHAEAVQISFDPDRIGYRDLLEIFFTIHDPTTYHRQGADVGPQYRSAVFYHSEEQKETAERVIKNLTDEAVWPRPIVTEVARYAGFFPAEDYHQEYFRKNPDKGYCQVVIAPKLAKFRRHHADRLKAGARA